MQIAAMNPVAVDADSVPAETVARERAIIIDTMKEDPKMAGKPEEMIAYLQDVKVKQHTKKTRNRCICCGQDDYIYSSYTTKS